MTRQTRCHVHEESFDVPPAELFALLHTPSAIRDWWRPARAVVLAGEGGFWAAAWRSDEDDPDYVTIAVFASSTRRDASSWMITATTPAPVHFRFRLSS